MQKDFIFFDTNNEVHVKLLNKIIREVFGKEFAVETIKEIIETLETHLSEIGIGFKLIIHIKNKNKNNE